ncbi:MAG TPA: hypothetical protein VF624_05730 [Tepidisphaeraceae bacterium]|jgi:hypothetical protein
MRFNPAIALTAGLIAAAAPAAELPTTQPTKVTLAIEARNGAEAATQLTQQLGFPVGMQQQVPRGIQFQSGEQPLVPALCAFFDKADVSPGDNDTMYLADGSPLSVVPLSDTAALVLTRTTVNASVQLNTERPQTGYNYTINLLLLTDPALKIVSAGRSATIDAIEYDGTPRDVSFGSGPSQMNLSSITWPVAVQFASTTAVKSVKRVTGRIRCRQVIEEASVDVGINDLMDGREVAGGAITVTAKIDDNIDRNVALSVTLSGPAVELYADPRWQQQLRNCVQAVNEQGRALPLPANNITRDPAGKKLTMRLMSARGNVESVLNELDRVRVRVPTKVRMIDVPFEFKDLPLP